MNLQDSFLNQVRRESGEVKILLTNGTELRGHVKGFDNFTVVLNSGGEQHLIYKHAIAQLVSKRTSSPRHAEEETSAEKPAERRGGQGKPAPKQKKESFNSMDFSSLNLKEQSEVKVPSE
ncbi:MAG: RNA chaperone Hfq [Candidatus Sumerlaeaceae bacterium]|nr:RNA chaperone Hfq [Candidatus Sumerlaeaceae bacterium]